MWNLVLLQQALSFHNRTLAAFSIPQALSGQTFRNSYPSYYLGFYPHVLQRCLLMHRGVDTITIICRSVFCSIEKRSTFRRSGINGPRYDDANPAICLIPRKQDDQPLSKSALLWVCMIHMAHVRRSFAYMGLKCQPSKTLSPLIRVDLLVRF